MGKELKKEWVYVYGWASLSSVVKNPPVSAGDTGSISGLGRFLEKEMPTHSSILAWKIHGQRSLAATDYGVTKESDITLTD